MSTIRVVLDKRKKLKDDKYSLSVRVCHKGHVQYLPISKLTVSQYDQIFVRQSIDQKSVDFRETTNEFKTKCERIFVEMGRYEPKRFRELVYLKDKEIPKTLVLKDLFDYYIENYEGITLKTRQHFRMSINKLESFQPGLTVNEITPEFLKHYELAAKDEGLSQSTINGILRNLRRIVNYFTHEKKTIPANPNQPTQSPKRVLRVPLPAPSSTSATRVAPPPSRVGCQCVDSPIGVFNGGKANI